MSNHELHPHNPYGPEALSGNETPITAENLYRDNRSPLAYENRRKNQRAVLAGETDTTFVCSDARVIVPKLTEAFIVGMISAGGNREEFSQLINNNGRSIINLAHFALPESEKDAFPIGKLQGCGGLVVKDLLEQGLVNGISENTAIQYVHDEVDHSDPLVQTALAALKMAQISTTGKPIAAAAENTLTGEVGILAVFRKNNGKVDSVYKPNFDPALIRPDNYNARRIYEDGIPFLNPEDLSQEFKPVKDYVQAQKEKMERIKDWYPNFSETQKVQNNVRAVLWTTSPRPAHLRFPTLFRKPGSLFTVSQTRAKDITYAGDYAQQRVQVTETGLKQGLKQVHYPLSEATAHVNSPEKAFHGANTVIIEASDFGTAIRMQNELLAQEWGQAWLKTPGAQILTIETQGGIIQQMGEFNFSSAA